MEELFTFGVALVIIGLIVLASSLITVYYMPPTGQPKFFTILLLGAGLTFIIVGFVCVILSMVFNQAVKLGVTGLEKLELPASIYVWSIIMAIIIIAGLLAIFDKITGENFMNLVMMIIGILVGGGITFAIRKLFR